MGIAIVQPSTYQQLKEGKLLLEIRRDFTISKMVFALAVVTGKVFEASAPKILQRIESPVQASSALQ